MLFALLIVTTAMIGAHSKAIIPDKEEIAVPPTPKHQGNFGENYNRVNIANLIDSWTDSDKQNVWELSGLYEGDIMFDDGDENEIDTQNGLVNPKFRWPDGVVPYYIEPNDFDARQIQKIKNAMEAYHRDTCITFRPYRNNDKDYIHIRGQSSGCWSYVGRRGSGQVVNLHASGCLGHGTIIHELLHAVGFYHQQSAADRDDWVTINWENISEGREHNFDKYDSKTVTDFGYSYDYSSVMHYSGYAFSKNGNETIVPKVNGVTIGQRAGMSEKDRLKVEKMYSGICSNRTQV